MKVIFNALISQVSSTCYPQLDILFYATGIF